MRRRWRPTARSDHAWERRTSVVLDGETIPTRRHRVRHRPQCPACGDAGLQAALGERPVELTSTAIGYRADGGFRREPPARSYARLRHLVSPILGPVNFLHPMPGRHAETRPVFAAGYFAVPQDLATSNVFDRNCAGKGCTGEQARMSALAEAIERYSGLYHGDEAVRHLSFAELGAEAVHPDELHLYSAAQVANGSAPTVLDPTTAIAWTPAWSLIDHQRRWVPLAYCYTHAPEEAGARYARPSSNGNAAGNCLEEAIFQSLLELIERDALISRHDPERMVADLEGALRNGYRAVVLLPNPVLGRVLGGPEMEPFFAACEAKCVPVFLHGNTHGRLPTAGADRFRTHFAQHTCSHPLEAMMGLVALLEGGVFERHPALRFVWLESGCSWLPYWLWRLDEEYEHMRNELLGVVSRRPSDYFRRQCAISFEPGEALLGPAIDAIGEQVILFGTDFPHIDHDSGVIDKLFQDSAQLGPDRLRAALWDNPARLLGLDLERFADQHTSK